MPYLGQTITDVFPTSISVDTATISTANISNQLTDANMSAGSVVQVVQTQTATPADSTSATFADTTLTANITPSSTSNKILVIVDHTNVQKTGSTQAGIKLFRGSTEIRESRYLGSTQEATRNHISVQILELDSPSSSSQITYKTQYNNEQATGTVSLQAGNQESTMTLMEIAG
mgnify:CR=1 FL=1|tara:strand:+ start:182 stop:703 length:522 start_codon:yes stop_codon:yes gene_type:complete